MKFRGSNEVVRRNVEDVYRYEGIGTLSPREIFKISNDEDLSNTIVPPIVRLQIIIIELLFELFMFVLLFIVYIIVFLFVTLLFYYYLLLYYYIVYI